MSAVFQYNEEKAIAADAGGGDYITESCVVRGFIEQAKWVEASSGAKGLELTFESEHGKKANYLTLYYQKKDGSINEVGDQQIQSLMGCTGAQSLSMTNNGSAMIAPELTRKPVQLALERENYVKGNGQNGFRFQIKCIMSAKSGLTIAEYKAGKQAESAGYWAQRFAQNPQGEPPKQQATQASGQHDYSNSYVPPADDMDDTIPF
ncbi:hypothetical protein [Vreelandella populi]|uniref:hypothetical protein n=1 Tax=Vreelandella populi TaxID=2498858 RepID=UPI000F8D8966|nr:hypothetical protein [Halomonas populi]RUR38505.1 hypothetical protein ELY25_09075 [Halomonas populi]